SAATLQINRAHSWSEFRTALRLWTAPAQNFVYADREGNIGYQLPGRIPIRAKGQGLLPVPGWTGEYEWVGEIPFEQLPSLFNPPRGIIVTANNRIVPERYPYFISADWDPGFRAKRIEAMLADVPHATLEDMAQIQLDLTSLPAHAFVAALHEINFNTEPAAGPIADLRSELLSWNGVLRPDSRPAAIYEAVRLSLVPLLFKDVLGPDLYKRYLGSSSAWQRVILHLLRTPSSPWWGPSGRDAVVAKAFKQADDLLRSQLGSDRSTWRWGRLHKMQFVHPLGRLPALGWMFNATAPATGGDAHTVNIGGFDVATFQQRAVASYRQILDVADWDRSLAIHTTGQSGLPFSRHYRDFVSPWARGRYHPMLFSRPRILLALEDTLSLVPKAP
ncbi:MAG TPA: penicillin acylase family protein, partial [bacterium]|nr:penicillin acylase family protein [bacterium]